MHFLSLNQKMVSTGYQLYYHAGPLYILPSHFPMENIIITIIIHYKGRYLWSATTAYTDNNFFTDGSHMFLSACEQVNLKALQFYFQEKYCLSPLPQFTLWDSSQTQLLLHAVGAFQGRQWGHENRHLSLASLRSLVYQRLLETPEQLLQSPNRVHHLFNVDGLYTEFLQYRSYWRNKRHIRCRWILQGI